MLKIDGVIHVSILFNDLEGRRWPLRRSRTSSDGRSIGVKAPQRMWCHHDGHDAPGRL
jgi:hypothetical protein